ncbi:MAG: hypothetical protein CMI54_02175 [Parcubacteria group bacterium]|nr:hypothetical protein [Parcubacteria group bacterium]|tara:strand:- start:8854 stop:9975 length:1122 start_codon:yes stop_codon:yes gene_type:complete
MKAAVLGVGRMGAAICYAMHKLGFYVVGADSYGGAVDGFRKYIKGKEGTFYLTDQNNADKSIERALTFEKPDVVISGLPYHQTEEMAYWCIDNGIRYCDLGGRVDVSRNINKYASESELATKPVFTDLGLAPGWVNIMAEWGCSKIHDSEIEEVRMMVGGIPAEKVNHPLDYVVTWSVDGLINEYKDDCKILKDGKIETVKGMDGLEHLNGGDLGLLEAFYTSGGASHTIHDMQKRGVKNCSYKTLRYQGHRDIVKFLMDHLTEDCFREVFERGCKNASDCLDLVLLKAVVKSENLTWEKDVFVSGDKGGFTAMQKATAFSVSSVAKIIAEGKLEGNKEQHRDYWTQYSRGLSYADVPFDEFNNNLKLLGITI